MNIRKELGLFGFCCPVLTRLNKDCSECPGYYHLGNNGYVCTLYDYSMRGEKKDFYRTLLDAFDKKELTKGCKYDILDCSEEE